MGQRPPYGMTVQRLSHHRYSITPLKGGRAGGSFHVFDFRTPLTKKKWLEFRVRYLYAGIVGEFIKLEKWLRTGSSDME